MLLGAFNFHLVSGEIALPLADGEYENLLGGTVTVQGGRAPAPLRPLLLHVTGQRRAQAAFREHEG